MTRSRTQTAILMALCALWFVLTMFPVYWVGINSFKPPQAVNAGPTFLPWVDFTPTVQAYVDAWSGKRGNFVNTFFNSIIVGLSATLISVVLGSMAAYALVRFEFRVRLLAALGFVAAGIGGYLGLAKVMGLGEVASMSLAFLFALAASISLNRLRLPGAVLSNNDVVFWFVSQRMMPPIVSAFALYLLYSKIGQETGLRALDSYWGLTLCYVAFGLPLVVWLMRDFFAAIPIEVEEAALVDNVPRLRIFWDIVLPMARPGLIAVALITLGFIWNEFLFALILTTGDWQTLPVLLAGQNSYRGDEWWAISVAVVISIGPMMVITYFLARMMRSGVMLGSIK